MLYVGKAQSLRNRVRSYWQKEAASGLGQHLIRSVIDRVVDVEYTVTDSVGEALLLEGNLVKRFQPPFNVRLKDDKSYPYIKITTNDDFPRIERTRKLPKDGSRYFGPYASASSVDEAMNLVRRLFPFRTCTIEIKEGVRALQRPCLLYHIKRCQGPCIEAISKAEYRADIEQVELFLEGRQESLVRALRDDMKRASERMDYEHAGITRDKIKAIERTMESQKMAAFARTDLDLLGLARRDNQAAVQLFVIRGGKALGRDVYLLDTPRGSTDEDVVSGFLLQYYARASSVPPEIALPVVLPDAPDLERFLSDRRARRWGGGDAREANPEGTLSRVENLTRASAGRRRGHAPARPRRERDAAGSARRAATGRATAAHAARDAQRRGDARARAGPLAGGPGQDARRARGAHRRARAATACPRGSSATTSRTSRARRRSRAWSSSRTASLEPASTAASAFGRSRAPTTSRRHREVLRRRFRGPRPGDEGSGEERRWAMPDLVLIDGGKPQVGAAKGVLDELGLHDLPLAGIAKEREELFLPDRADPIVLPPTSQALYLVQRIRDEAHRFAITYHRDLRRKASVRSKFDDLPGVGPRRRGALLRVFGSIKRVARGEGPGRADRRRVGRWDAGRRRSRRPGRIKASALEA